MTFAKLTACPHCRKVGRILPNKVAEFDYRNVTGVHLCRTGEGDVVIHYNELGLEKDPKPVNRKNLSTKEEKKLDKRIQEKEE